MKSFLMFILMTVLVAVVASPTFAAGGFKGEKFQHVVYLESGGKGNESGLNAANAKDIEDADLWAIPAGTLIEKVYVVIGTALTGTTVLAVGDDDDADGFVVNSDITLGSAGLYGYGVGYDSAAYLKKYVVGASDPTKLAPAAKYYAASGKEVKLDNTTTNTAGVMKVVIEGYRF